MQASKSCKQDSKPEDSKEAAEDQNEVKFEDNDAKEDDSEFLVDAAETDLEEIEIGKLAQQKGTDAEVYHAEVPEYYLPKKEDVYTKMEALIWHFKIIMGEINLPKGQIYSAVEGGNGELGFYIVSDGGKNPYRIRVRPPCLPIFSSFATG